MCSTGRINAVREAIGSGEDVNNKSFDRKTGLMRAVIGKHNSIVRLLLEQPTLDLNCTDDGSQAALHFAAMFDNVEGTRMLLADPRLNTHNHKDNEGGTPVMLAMFHDSVNTLRTLIAHPSVDLDTRDGQRRSLEYHAR